jgi:phosphoesterase RecJ-like protein
MQAKKEHQEKAKKIVAYIEQNEHFLVSAHVNADGDAIASVIAIGLLLDKMNKHFEMVLHDQKLDFRFTYLKNFDKIHPFYEDLLLQIENAIILDAPGLNRLGDVAGLLPQKSNIIKIDHHPVEDDFAFLNLVDEGASSSTQLVYEIIEASGIEIDIEIAKAIYSGIVYDTGRLSFSNTSSRDLYICGRMIDLGVNPSEIINRIFFESSFEALRTIGKGLATMESYLDGQVNIIYLDNETMKENHQGEIEELANYSVAIRGGKVGIFIREIKPNFHKISLRAKYGINVNRVAKTFDGGGHKRAAGCRIEGPKEEVIAKLVDEIAKRM